MEEKQYGNLYWRIESACPLRCKMCLGHSNTMMSIRDADYENKLLNEAKQLGFKTMVFTGGEPTLRPKLDLLIKKTYENGFMTRLDTNGVYLDHDSLSSMKGYLTLLGLPLHSSKAKIHDNIVGKQSHSHHINTLLSVSSSLKIPVKVTTAVTKENIDDVKNIANHLSRHYPPKIYGINAIVKRQCKSWVYQMLKIEEKDFRKLEESLSAESYPFKLSFCFGHKDSDMAYIFVNPDFTVAVTAGDSEHIVGDLKNEHLEKILSKVKIDHELHMRRFSETNL